MLQHLFLFKRKSSPPLESPLVQGKTTGRELVKTLKMKNVVKCRGLKIDFFDDDIENNLVPPCTRGNFRRVRAGLMLSPLALYGNR
jgi:hypothetical protein